MINWDKILDDFARKCKGGAPDMTNPRHLALLRESLLKFGWNENATNEFVGNLREGETVLDKKVLNPDTGRKIKVRSALRYDKSTSVYQAAAAMIKQSTETDDDDAQVTHEVETIEGMTAKSIDEVDGTAKDDFFKGETTAPGTKESAVNEIGTGYGMAYLNENPNATQEEVMKYVHDTLRDKGWEGDLSSGHLQSIANSSRREFNRVHGHMDKVKPKMSPETTKVSHIWGSKQSLAKTAKRLEELKEQGVEYVNGIHINDYIKVVSGGGGGGDPTDTMVLMVDEGQKPPKVEILHTSNKMSNADIQANSGPTESLRLMDERIDNSNLTQDEKNSAKAETNNVRKTIKDKNAEISRVVGAQAPKFNGLMQNDEQAQTMLTILQGDYQTKPFGISLKKGSPGKYWKKGVLTNPVVKKLMEEKFGKDWKKYMDDPDGLIIPSPDYQGDDTVPGVPVNVSDVQKEILRVYAKDLERKQKLVSAGKTKSEVEQMAIDSIEDEKVRAKKQKAHDKKWKTKDDEPYTLTDNDQRILIAVGENEDKLAGKKSDPEFSVNDVEQLYRDQFNAMNGMRKSLNEKHDGLGDEMFKAEMIDRMHLNVAEGHNPGSSDESPGIPEDNFELNMGRNESSIKYHKETGEMYQRVGRKYYKIDPKTGKQIVDKDGNPTEARQGEMTAGDTATIATPEIIAGCVTGKDVKPPLKQDTLQNNIQVGEKAYEDVKTGRQATYIIYDMEGREICKQTIRSKSGLGGNAQDTIQWSDDMMACMQRKSHNIASKK